MEFKNTKFLINVPYEKLPYLYSACDVFVLPSKHEGFSYTLLEAMSCELLFVISKVGGALEIYQKVPQLRKFILDDLKVELFMIELKKSWKLMKLKEMNMENWQEGTSLKIVR